MLQSIGLRVLDFFSSLFLRVWQEIKEILLRLFGVPTQRSMLAEAYRLVKKINALESQVSKMTQENLVSETKKMQNDVQSGRKTLEDCLPLAFAIVREAASRVLGMRHYDVQLIGGITLHKGIIAEMCTGEGKTLVSTLPAYLNALNGKGVHIVTVNDYLAKRDSEWMGQVHQYLGLSVGCVTHETPDRQKRDAYFSDITYVTNNEVGFDYLRDNMEYSESSLRQKVEHTFAIVDEVDSILIDESRTPLIISGAAEDASAIYNSMNEIVKRMNPEDYEIEEKHKTATFKQTGITKLEKILKNMMLLEENDTLYDPKYTDIVHVLQQNLKANTLYNKDVDYMVRDGEVFLIDEFTGRVLGGRRYSEGLHQAIEAKEGVEVKNESVTIASITYQSYFRMYKKLSGMTGTASTEAEEFRQTYGLTVLTIPTHKPIARVDQNDLLYRTNQEKVEAICAIVRERHERGQPILVGTSSVEKSEEFSAAFKEYGIPHSTLNAKYHAQEANIISNAGQIGAVTIATNMAGRGTDIKLGGKDESAKEQVLQFGGLFVIGTERHENRRIDNQLRGRAGRQGDPGESRFCICLEDKLIKVFGGDTMNRVMEKEQKDGEPLEGYIVNYCISGFQQKLERHYFETRKHILKYDEVLNEQRKIIYSMRQAMLHASHKQITRQIFEMIIEALSEITHEQNEPEVVKKLMSAIFGISIQPDDDVYSAVLEKFMSKSDKAHEIVELIIHDDLSNHSDEVYLSTKIFHCANPIRSVFLQTIDRKWRNHITYMENLKQQCQLQSYAQKDPLSAYKNEALPEFQKLIVQFKREIISTTSRIVDKTN